MMIPRPRKNKVGRGALIGLLLALAGGLAMPPAHALNQAQRAYLDSIREEMDSLGMDLVGGGDQQGSASASSRTRKSASKRGAAEQREAAKQQFEQRLQDRSPGTFILYKRLDGDQQAQVVKEYTETGDLRRARSKIMRFTRGH